MSISIKYYFDLVIIVYGKELNGRVIISSNSYMRLFLIMEEVEIDTNRVKNLFLLDLSYITWQSKINRMLGNV